jgi:hypothetical protein
LFRYSEECLLRISKEEMDWRSEQSNDENNSKIMGKGTTLLGNG